MTRLKIRKIGNSLGVVLPKDVLDQLKVKEGDKLDVLPTASGVTLSVPDDLFTLASLYAAGLIRNPPFLDGRKQIGFLSALLFREANGRKMAAPMAERLAFTLQLAASEIDEKICADWLRRSCIPV